MLHNQNESATSIQTFKFEDTSVIEVVLMDGNPWFVAIDVCRVLGLTNTTESLKSLEDDEHLTSVQLRAGQQRIVNLISESGFYTLSLRCRDAVIKGSNSYRFRRWVTREVLPAIHKTGSYTYPTAQPQPTESYELESLRRQLEFEKFMHNVHKERTEYYKESCHDIRNTYDKLLGLAIEMM